MQARLTVALFLSVLLNLTCPAFAQTPSGMPTATDLPEALQPPIAARPTLFTSVHEVDLVLSVTDHKGKFVPDLLPSQLTILDNGQEQTAITFFQRQTNLPLDVALLIDSSSSVTYKFPDEQKTIKHFIKSVIRPNDRVAVFAFNEKVSLAAEVNNNWKQMAKKIMHLKPGGDTAIYDAVSAAASWLGKDHRPSRQIMILLTDGEENSSKTSMADAITNALKANASIYAVNVSAELDDPEQKQGREVLVRLTDATGGAYLEDTGDNGNNAFRKIERELRTQYAIAYKPSNLEEAVFHRIRVLAPGKLRVRCRSGYYASQNALHKALMTARPPKS